MWRRTLLYKNKQIFSINYVRRIPLLGLGFSRQIALIVSLITFIFSINLNNGVSYFGPFELRIDGLSLPFVLLTTFSIPVVILSSWSSNKSKSYLACMLVLESILIGFFKAIALRSNRFFLTPFAAILCLSVF